MYIHTQTHLHILCIECHSHTAPNKRENWINIENILAGIHITIYYYDFLLPSCFPLPWFVKKTKKRQNWLPHLFFQAKALVAGCTINFYDALSL